MMLKNESCRLVLKCFLLTLILAGVCEAGFVFEDDFSMNPTDNGWTQSHSSSGSGLGAISLAPSGNQVVFDKTSGSGPVDFSIMRTIATRGFEDITLNLTAFQSSTGFEASDFLEVEYNPGGGFLSLLKDVEVWNGEFDLVGESSSGTDGQTSPISTGDLILPDVAANNLMLQIRISGSVNANAEDYFLDHISVSGTATAIPEVSPLLGFAFIACTLFGKQIIRRTTRFPLTRAF